MPSSELIRDITLSIPYEPTRPDARGIVPLLTIAQPYNIEVYQQLPLSDFLDQHRFPDLGPQTSAILEIIPHLAEFLTQTRPSSKEVPPYLNHEDHYGLTQYLAHLKREVASAPNSPAILALRLDFNRRFNGILAASGPGNKINPVRLFEVCSEPDTTQTNASLNRYGVFGTLYPEFNRLLQNKLNKASYILPNSIPLNLAQETDQLLKRSVRNSELSVQEYLRLYLITVYHNLCEGNDVPALNIESLAQIALDFAEKTHLHPPPDSQLLATEISSLFPESVIAKSTNQPELTPNPFSNLSNKEKAGRAHRLLESGQPLIHPESFGLHPEPHLTELARISLRPYGYRFGQGNPEERLRRNHHLFVITPKEIRSHPHEFYQYQRALVIKIAQQLGIPLDKSISIPPPHELKADHKRQEIMSKYQMLETEIKNLSDWHYLLLYPEVQKIFLHMLPYCGLPPIASYKIHANRHPDQVVRKGLTFPWVRKTHPLYPALEPGQSLALLNQVNQFPLFHHHKRAPKLTLPGMFLLKLFEKHPDAIPMIVHGTARAFYTADQAWYNIDPHAYSQGNSDPPPHDLDLLLFSSQDVSPGTLCDKFAKPIAGILGGLMLGRSMRGIPWGYVQRVMSKTKRDNSYQVRPQGESEYNLLQAITAWMGPIVDQPTTSLVLGLANLAKNRSFGLLPQIRHIAGQPTIWLKPIDLFGGLEDHFLPSNEPSCFSVISFPSYPCAFPRHELISYWLFFRTVADVIYMNAHIPDPEFPALIDQLLDEWPQISSNLDPTRSKDIAYEASKALRKAFSANPGIALNELIELKSPKGRQLIDFFPHLKLLHDFNAPNGFSVIWDKIDALLTDPQFRRHQDGVECITDILLHPSHHNLLGFLPLSLHKRIQANKESNQDEQIRHDLQDWLFHTIFST